MAYGVEYDYDLVLARCEQAGITPFCPRCVTDFGNQLGAVQFGWLHRNKAMDPISRRKPGLKICRACGAAEALADRGLSLDDSMARTVVEQDRQESMRLPAGGFWGVSYWPTGGLEEWIVKLNDRYNKLLKDVDGRHVVEPGHVLRVHGCRVEVGLSVIHLDLDPDVFWEDVHARQDQAADAPDTGTRQDEGGQGPVAGDR